MEKAKKTNLELVFNAKAMEKAPRESYGIFDTVDSMNPTRGYEQCVP